MLNIELSKKLKKEHNNQQGDCLRNAIRLSVFNGLTYIEGFVVNQRETKAVAHCWNVDKEGNVVDTSLNYNTREAIRINQTMQYLPVLSEETKYLRVGTLQEQSGENYKKVDKVRKKLLAKKIIVFEFKG